jgi:hypothetical protein
MTYSEWLVNMPEMIKQDALWKVEAYRLGCSCPIWLGMI